MKRLLPLLAAVPLLGACGGGDAAAPTTTAKPRTVTRTVEVTPPECLTALDLAQDAMDYAADGFYAAADGLAAVTAADITAVREARGRMERAGEKVRAMTSQWHAARDACRDGG